MLSKAGLTFLTSIFSITSYYSENFSLIQLNDSLVSGYMIFQSLTLSAD